MLRASTQAYSTAPFPLVTLPALPQAGGAFFAYAGQGDQIAFHCSYQYYRMEALISTYLISHLESVATTKSKVLMVAVVASRVLEKYDRTEVSVLATRYVRCTLKHLNSFTPKEQTRVQRSSVVP